MRTAQVADPHARRPSALLVVLRSSLSSGTSRTILASALCALLAFLYRRRFGSGQRQRERLLDMALGSDAFNEERLERRAAAQMCVICGQTCVAEGRWAQPFINIPGDTKAVHLKCALHNESGLAKAFVDELRELVTVTGTLETKKDPSVRLCYENYRLEKPETLCTMSGVPPKHAFSVNGIREIRISSCAIRTIPAEIGRLRSLKSLVLMTLQIEAIPDEVGNLKNLEQMFLNGNFLRAIPDSVGQLPVLADVCFDANMIEVLPRFTSKVLRLFTAPANRLKKLPALYAGKLERLEVHGNNITVIDPGFGDGAWSRLQYYKSMGNRIPMLPGRMFASMRWLSYIGMSDNSLRSLPQEIVGLPFVATILLYNNQLTELPAGLVTKTPKLKQILLEGNPLSPQAMEELVLEVESSRLSTLAIDEEQCRSLFSRGSSPFTAELPQCITVGNLVKVNEPDSIVSGMYLKLVRCSQLRRQPGVGACGAPGGPALPADAPAEVLVVAFAASQGEPEWLGLLRTIAGPDNAADAAKRYHPLEAKTLTNYLGQSAQAQDNTRFAPLWELDEVEDEDVDKQEAADDFKGERGIPDFDILCVCDARMRWYVEDADVVGRALAPVCSRYKKKLFIGASMGGYAALRHGGDLADAVLAFGPQAMLQQAILRPPAADISELELKANAVQEAVLRARRRGARVQIHAAADTHLEHALYVNLADNELTIHPLNPRTPFAKLLDRVGVLWPLVATSIATLSAAVPPSAPLDHLKLTSSPEARVAVARWVENGCRRYATTREEVLHYFFGGNAPMLPFPGDWYCCRCCKRNQKRNFFCATCGQGCRSNEEWAQVPTVADFGTRRVPDRGYPKPGDWGCGGCGNALTGRDRRCSCGVPYADPRNVVVPGSCF